MRLDALAALLPPPEAGDGPDAALPIAEAVRRELVEFDAGDVRLQQELLNLAGFECAVDGDRGPKTRGRTALFQRKTGLPSTGQYDEPTFRALVLPIVEACALPDASRGARGAVFGAGRSHAAAKARELPPNLGPWVRLFMAGYEGASWPWCAGFASFVWIQAAAAVAAQGGRADAVERARRYRSFSCDVIAQRAIEDGRFVSGHYVYNGQEAILPGDLFLVQSRKGDWVHVGIVGAVRNGGREIGTIEGNTNAGGSREGLYVLERNRRVTAARYSGLDFVRCPFA